MDFETRAIHDGQEPDPATGSVITPIYQTSTYVQEAVGESKGYDYARTANPTRTALETALASLEGAGHGLAYSSGLGATTTIMHLVDPGQRVVLIADVYGGVYRMTSRIYEPKGYRFTYVPAEEFDDNLASYLDDDVALVWVETPSNPLLNIVDIRRAALAAHAAGAILAVDNTFATPYLQLPLEHGADLVVHSTTKYLNGHSDVVGGAIVGNDRALGDRLRFLQNAMGGSQAALDSFLTLRGTKTLAVRMERHQENALRIARWLERRPEVERVHYPGLRSHPQHALARKQMSGFGGMVSFQLRGGRSTLRRARALLRALRVFACAESLGGVESLAEHPAIMTHASIPAERRRALGIGDGLVRLSVGIEHADDLIVDLTAALRAANAA
jgi:cystathionine gamma-lyase